MPPTSPAGAAVEAPHSVTGRALVAVLVLIALSLSLALPVREFLNQRSRLAELTAHNASAQATIDQLAAQKARWQDPAYVEAQARARLHVAKPGQLPFIVAAPAPGAAAAKAPAAQDPWYQRLWRTLTRQGS